MSATDQMIDKFKSWEPKDLEKLACKLLALSSPGFHGSKTVHFAGGEPKKIIDNTVRDI